MGAKKKMTKRLAALGLSLAAAISGGYLIVPLEGSVTNSQGLHTAYKDPIGIITYCNGLTGKDLYARDVHLGMTYTQQECDKMLAQRINQFEKEIDSVVKVPYSSIWQKAALISFTYNIGFGAFRSSTLLKKLNAKDYAGACNELTKWVYANKKRLNGLVSRRNEERLWCMGEADWDAQKAYKSLIQGYIQQSYKEAEGFIPSS